MPERRYAGGKKRHDLRTAEARMSESRWAWTRNNIGQFVILVDDAPPEELLEGESQEGGRTIRLFHPRPGKPSVSWDLTSLTAQELAALREIVESAFDWAEPICEIRDKEAQDAFAAGDDSYPRIYRQVPELVYRKRPEPQYSEGVQHGPEDVSPVGGEADTDPGAVDGVLRGDGDDVAERNEGGSKPTDNWPSPNQPPSV